MVAAGRLDLRLLPPPGRRGLSISKLPPAAAERVTDGWLEMRLQ